MDIKMLAEVRRAMHKVRISTETEHIKKSQSNNKAEEYSNWTENNTEVQHQTRSVIRIRELIRAVKFTQP